MKAPWMLLLLCCFFYPLCAQVYIEQGTELSVKDSAFYSMEEKLSRPVPVLYIVEGTEVHNLEKISDVKIISIRKAEPGDSNRSLLTDRRKAAIPKVEKEKQKTEILPVKPEAYISQDGSSIFNASEYAGGGGVVFASANTFQVKQGIVSEKYKVSIITTEEAFVCNHSRKESVRKMNSFIIRIRPPPF